MRLVAAITVLAACAGSPKPTPANAVAPEPVVAAPPAPHDDPPPPEPETTPQQVAVADHKGGDPCEGGEVTGGLAQGEGAGGGAVGTGAMIGSNGRGGLRGRTPVVPSVTLGEPTVKGDLDAAIVRRYVKRNLNKIRYCYEKELLAKPDLRGKLVVKLAINDQGKTEEVTAPTSFSGEVGKCVVGVFQDIEFPKPKSNRVTVSYPFTFASSQ